MPDIRQTTSYLDDFDRADEVPLSNGGKWSQTKSGIWCPMVLDNQTATHHDACTTSDSYWNVRTFENDEAEIWGRPEGGVAPGIAWALDLWTASSAGGAGTDIDGYRFRSDVSSGGATWLLRRFDSGTATVIDNGGVGISGGGANVRMLIRILGDEVEGWHSNDSGANWTKVVSATDTTYRGAFYIGIGITDESSSQILGWETIGGGGGSLWLPQQIRRPAWGPLVHR